MKWLGKEGGECRFSFLATELGLSWRKSTMR